MPLSENSPDSEQELRWQTWQEKSRRSDRLADKRMKVIFSIVGLILLAWVLYYALGPKGSSDSDHVQRALAVTIVQFSSPYGATVIRSVEA